jgi:hypothetical protein
MNETTAQGAPRERSVVQAGGGGARDSPALARWGAYTRGRAAWPMLADTTNLVAGAGVSGGGSALAACAKAQ